jgi:hypothetical protein
VRISKLLSSLAVIAAALSGVASAARAESEVGYKKGFFLEARDGDRSYSLVVNGVLQTRFALTLPDGGDDSYAFDVVRARVGLKGNILSEDLTYRILVELGHGDTQLKDLWVDYAFTPGVQLRVGQWKRPFSRQFMTSATAQQLVDVALTERAFDTGRDLGLAVHNDYERSPTVEWVVGLFNGTHEKPWYTAKLDATAGTVTSISRTNVPAQFRPVAVARVGYNHGDMAGEGYSSADLHPDKGLRFGVAASGLVDFGLDDDTGAIAADLDFILKVSGFAVSGAFFVRTLTGDASGLDRIGFAVDAGYVIGGTVEPVLRFARVVPDDDAEATTQELAFGLNVYFVGNTFKWATDVAALGHELGGTATTDVRVRSQLQLVF